MKIESARYKGHALRAWPCAQPDLYDWQIQIGGVWVDVVLGAPELLEADLEAGVKRYLDARRKSQ